MSTTPSPPILKYEVHFKPADSVDHATAIHKDKEGNQIFEMDEANAAALDLQQRGFRTSLALAPNPLGSS